MSFPGKCFLIFYVFTIIGIQIHGQEQVEKFSFVNPTGTYILKGKKSGNEIRGPFAEVRVKLLDEETIALSSYFNTGFPDYHSESFLDTLSYVFNSAKFTHNRDRYCKIVFRFSNADVDLLYVFPDNGHTCIFNHGTIATGKIEKSYTTIPIIAGLNRESASDH
jgi:hypothetical protein